MLAGASAFLPKPIDRRALLDEIAGQLKLTWTMSTPTNEIAHRVSVPMPSPAAADLEELHRVALTGNMRAIRERAADIAAADPACAEFCDKLQSLASAYQSKAILSLVKEHLQKARAG